MFRKDKTWNKFKTVKKETPTMAMTLTITLNDNGSVLVNGPLNNKIICWGLLTAAQDVIRTYNPAEQPLIEVPTFEAPADVARPVIVED